MLPDTIITLYKGSETNHQSVAFIRLKTYTIFPKGCYFILLFLRNYLIAYILANILPAALWYELQHDLSHRKTNTIGFPGSVLLKMSISNVEDITEVKFFIIHRNQNFYLFSKSNNWESERRKLEIKKAFCLRVFIYQCKNLPSVDDFNLIDPYVKVILSL
jgi:hypothetical protein